MYSTVCVISENIRATCESYTKLRRLCRSILWRYTVSDTWVNVVIVVTGDPSLDSVIKEIYINKR